MTPENYICGQLATIGFIDGRNSGWNGMLGVCYVVRNRVLKNWHEGDWVRTVWGLVSAQERYWGEAPDVRDPIFLELLMVMDSIYEGTREDKLTQGALWYVDHTNPNPTKTFDMSRHERVAQIGLLSFYR